MPVDYTDRKIMVIEDLPEFRMNIRQMLLSFGANDVTLCASAQDAINACHRNEQGFEIILCDYHLGESKDGQQLLEELRILGLIEFKTIFIMITAENSVDMVLGALEFRPDAYLTKPFNKSELRSRLDRIYKMKDELYELNCALDESDLEDAVMQCDLLLKEKTPYATQVVRAKSEILFKLNRMQDCRDLITPIIEEKGYEWAKLGLAKVLCQTGEYKEAEAILNDLIQRNHRNVEIYDWLFQIKKAAEDTEGAQKILKQAVLVSPKSRSLQSQLACLAEQNEDFDTAARAYRRTLELSKNTIHMNPKNVISLVDCLYKKAERDPSLHGKKAANDALRIINENNKDLKKDNNTLLQSKMVEAQIYHVQHKDAKAEACLKEAKRLKDEVSVELGPETTLRMAEGFLSMKDYDEALILMNSINEQDLEDDEDKAVVLKLKEKMMENEDFRDYKQQMSPENQEGIRCYESGNTDSAIKAFLKAKKVSPDSVAINLNLLQAIIKKIQQEKPTKKLIHAASGCLGACKDLPFESEKYPRYEQLKRILSNIESSGPLS